MDGEKRLLVFSDGEEGEEEEEEEEEEEQAEEEEEEGEEEEEEKEEEEEEEEMKKEEGWRLLAYSKQRARKQRQSSSSSSESEGEDTENEEEEGSEESGESLSRGFLDEEAEEGEEEEEEEGEEEEMEWDSEEEGFVLEEAVDETWHSSKRQKSTGNKSEENSYSSSDEKEGEEGTVRWKEGLVERAAEAFGRRRSSSAQLHSLIYSGTPLGSGRRDVLRERKEELEEELAGLFKVSQRSAASVYHVEDSSLVRRGVTTSDWTDAETISAVKCLFVTGGWGAEDARTLLEEDEVYGDFEDLETGERNEGGGEEKEEGVRLKQKMKLKAAFDEEYDAEEGGGGYLEDLKSKALEQAEVNRAEFQDLDTQTRVQYEGVVPGNYVRMELKGLSASPKP